MQGLILLPAAAIAATGLCIARRSFKTSSLWARPYRRKVYTRNSTMVRTDSQPSADLSADLNLLLVQTAVRQLINSTNGVPAAASRFLRYVDSSPTPFHATAVSADMLEKAGFVRLRETESWQGLIEAGGKYL